MDLVTPAGSAADGRVKSAVFFWAVGGRVKSAVYFLGLFGFFLFPLRSIFFGFLTRFFTITDFSDDGSVADGGTKSAVFSWFIWIFLFPLRSIFGFFFN